MAFAGSAPASRPAFAAVTLGMLLPGACATAPARDLVWISVSFACWSTAVHALRDLGFRRLGLISGFETDAQHPQETPPEIVSGSLPPTR